MPISVLPGRGLTAGGLVEAYGTINASTSQTLTNMGNVLVMVDSTNGPVTVTLNQAFHCPGAWVFVRRATNNTNTVTVVPQGSDTIDGLTTRTLPADGGSRFPGGQYFTVALISTGAGYTDMFQYVAMAGVQGQAGTALQLSGQGTAPGVLQVMPGATGYVDITGGNTSTTLNVRGGTTIAQSAPASVPLTIKQASSQTADSLQIWNAAATPQKLAYFDSSGNLHSAGLSWNSDIYIYSSTNLYLESAGAIHFDQGPLIIGNGAIASFGGGTGPMMFLANDTADPGSNPTGGTIIFSSAGVLKARTPDGTITQIAPAIGGVSFPLTNTAATAAAVEYQTNVTADTQYRFQITADGTQKWGTGAAVTDAQIYRASSGVLNIGGINSSWAMGDLGFGSTFSGLIKGGLAAATTAYAFMQDNSGNTYVNAATGGTLYARIANATVASLSGGGTYFTKPVGISGTGPSVGNWLTITAAASTDVPLIITGAASQTADLLDIRNSGGTVMTKVASDGSMQVAQYITINGHDPNADYNGNITSVGYAGLQGYGVYLLHNAAGSVNIKPIGGGQGVFSVDNTIFLGSGSSTFWRSTYAHITFQNQAGSQNVGRFYPTTTDPNYGGWAFGVLSSGVPADFDILRVYDGNALTTGSWSGIFSVGYQVGTRIKSNTATTVPLTIRGAAGQTGDLLDLQNSSGTILGGYDATGRPYLGAASSFGGGTGPMLFVGNDTADPSSNPTGGVILFSSAGVLKARDPSGAVTQIAPAIAPTVSWPLTDSSQTNSANTEYQTRVSGDTNYRFVMATSGYLQWGPGTAGVDAFLQRTAIGTLSVNYALAISNSIYPGTIPFTITTAAGQTAALMNVNTNLGNVFAIAASGAVTHTSTAAGTIPLTLTGYSAQTADLLDIKALSTDAYNRFAVTSSGGIALGIGTTATDAAIYRTGTNLLAIGGGSPSSNWSQFDVGDAGFGTNTATLSVHGSATTTAYALSANTGGQTIVNATTQVNLRVSNSTDNLTLTSTGTQLKKPASFGVVTAPAAGTLAAITANASTDLPMVITGSATQSADLLDIKTSSAKASWFDSSGMLHITAPTNAVIPLTITGAASPSADNFHFNNSAGTCLICIDPQGYIGLGAGVAGGGMMGYQVQCGSFAQGGSFAVADLRITQGAASTNLSIYHPSTFFNWQWAGTLQSTMNGGGVGISSSASATAPTLQLQSLAPAQPSLRVYNISTQTAPIMVIGTQSGNGTWTVDVNLATTIQPQVATSVPLTIWGYAAQSANLLTIGTGAVSSWFDSGGMLHITAPATTSVPLTITGASGQTADMFDIYTSGNATKLFSINNTGYLWLSSTQGGFINMTGATSCVLEISGPVNMYPSSAASYGLDVDTTYNGVNNTIPLALRFAAAQTVDVMQFIGGSAVLKAGFDPTARLYLGSTYTFSGGTGPMMYLGNDTADPTGYPTTGIILYSSAGTLKARDPSGLVTQLAPGYRSNYVQTLSAPTVASSPYTVTHNLGTTNVLVQMYDAVTTQMVQAQVAIVNANSITVSVGTNMPNNINVIVFGVPTSPQPIQPGDYATKSYVDARTPNLPAPVTTGTTVQSFTDTLGDVWVALNGVSGGAWKRAVNVLHARWWRTTAITSPVNTETALLLDFRDWDDYGLYGYPSNAFFTLPIPGWWRIDWQIAATPTASGQAVQAYLNNNGVVGTGRQAIGTAHSSWASWVTARTTWTAKLAAGATINTNYVCSVAMGVVNAGTNTWATCDYLGTG